MTRIVGDINSTLVRKLEDLEHRVLMRIENLQRYEEQTMGALTARVDALERTSSSLRFQNEMIQVCLMRFVYVLHVLGWRSARITQVRPCRTNWTSWSGCCCASTRRTR